MSNERDPFMWAAVWSFIPDPLRAAIVSALVALVRVMYDDSEPSIIRRGLECTLCGAISLCVVSGMQAIGITGDFAVVLGGGIGLLGADTVRGWARRVGEARVKDIEE